MSLDLATTADAMIMNGSEACIAKLMEELGILWVGSKHAVRLVTDLSRTSKKLIFQSRPFQVGH